MSATHFPTAATFAAALAAGAVLVACDPAIERTQVVALSPIEGPMAAPTGRPVNQASDAAITVAVNTALAEDRELGGLGIDVNTVDGHVVLDGSAPDADARRRATLLARNVDGVRSVDNRLVLTRIS